jgi:hypothetical protein
MTAKVCPDCGETITYRSCQQPDTDAIAELALLAHRQVEHGATESITDLPLIGRAFAQALAAREREGRT